MDGINECIMLLERTRKRCPFLESLIPAILRDLGKEDMLTDPAAHNYVWGKFKDMWLRHKKGGKVGMGRFMAFLKVSEPHDPIWHLNLAALVYLGHQVGFIHEGPNSKLEKFRQAMAKRASQADAAAKPDAAEGDGKQKVKMKEGNDAVKRLKVACSNTLHLCTLLLSDELNQCRQCILCRMSKPVHQWRGHQSVVLRSCAESRVWMLEQVSGARLEIRTGSLMAP